MIRFAYIIKSSQEKTVHHTNVQSNGTTLEIYSVNSFEQAAELAKRLVNEGIECIELCGAFQEAGKQQVVTAINCKIPVGHVVYTNSELEKHQKLFSKRKKS